MGQNLSSQFVVIFSNMHNFLFVYCAFYLYLSMGSQAKLVLWLHLEQNVASLTAREYKMCLGWWFVCLKQIILMSGNMGFSNASFSCRPTDYIIHTTAMLDFYQFYLFKDLVSKGNHIATSCFSGNSIRTQQHFLRLTNILLTTYIRSNNQKLCVSYQCKHDPSELLWWINCLDPKLLLAVILVFVMNVLIKDNIS